MAFRKRRHDSEGDSDEERLPINKDEDEDLKAEPAKKSKNMWSDMLLEEQLLEKGQQINLDRTSRKQPNVSRGPESYLMPQDEFQRKQSRNANQKKKNEVFDKPVVLVTPASDDLFGDAPSALNEDFGVKKNDVKLPKDDEAGWWGKKGANKRYNDRMGYHSGGPRQPYPRKTTGQLMASEYSLESMVAAEFAPNLSTKELGTQMAAAMGEKDPDTVKKITNAIGSELSIKLFNETKEIEQNGGMKTADGSRRRTPGGVFITLFKMDSSVSREIKDGIFGDMRNAEKERTKKKKGEKQFTRQLEDMKKTMELAAQAETDLANEEQLATAVDAPFSDDAVDMV
ncbi:Phosphorylated adapter RNA export protein [Caenorhabditis elegans]|uniref:Phosphorylated adapter RNA export protein n=1 Tax=Caenorhabditis elegans TaxID=6239 RepID=Q9N4E8_CAEEL|nr:Phosphorylated adapter RNA export protein [Caenorhabditis elegans]CCD72401.1 Phosphorylated adapter RNA export protein [Caenorhabditis elegans]|eukprot:NP_497592.1 Uncharacterized protein CELE_Y71H2B.2 [Caenorhabditis elegans]